MGNNDTRPQKILKFTKEKLNGSIGNLLTLLAAVIAGGIAYGTVRADVDNLEDKTIPAIQNSIKDHAEKPGHEEARIQMERLKTQNEQFKVQLDKLDSLANKLEKIANGSR